MKVNKRYIFLILACIFVILSLFFINQIYGKYLTSANGTAVMPISRWDIKVNTQDIRNNSNISNKITPVFPGNDYIAANIIAPTAEGYFDLIFDVSAVDVSFRYSISTTVDSSSAVSDLIVTGYSIDDGTRITFPTSDTTIADTILLSSHVTSRRFRIYVMWNDNSSTASMNNQADTASTTLSNSSAKFNVAVSFTQITGN